jgi:hypothetical protein
MDDCIGDERNVELENRDAPRSVGSAARSVEWAGDVLRRFTMGLS